MDTPKGNNLGVGNLQQFCLQLASVNVTTIYSTMPNMLHMHMLIEAVTMCLGRSVHFRIGNIAIHKYRVFRG